MLVFVHGLSWSLLGFDFYSYSLVDLVKNVMGHYEMRWTQWRILLKLLGRFFLHSSFNVFIQLFTEVIGCVEES